MDAVRFYTNVKTVTSKWPQGIRAGAEFKMPTLGWGNMFSNENVSSLYFAGVKKKNTET